jgi:phenylpropionate dioxygenase-like ring-hydroxylating dioxygenase large terminal subunit
MDLFVRNAWYVAAWSKEIAGAPFSRRILGEPVVMYRKPDGTPVALLDRCPHKLAPLSLGRVIEDRLQCGYHGLEYDGTGRCVRVPGQPNLPPQARVRSFPLVERYGAVWIWTGNPALADPRRLIKVERYGVPGWAAVEGGYQYHRASYLTIADNLQDPAHTTYVHARTIGNPAASDVPVSIQQGKDEQGNEYVLAFRWTNNAEPPPLDRKIGSFDGLADRCQYYYFYPPCVSRVDVVTLAAGQEHSEENMDRGLRAFSYKFLTPETGNRTHFFWMHVRNFKVGDRAFEEEFVRAMGATFEEDNEITSAVQREQDATGLRQCVWIAVDAASTRVQRMIEKLAEAERASTANEPQPSPARSIESMPVAAEEVSHADR